MNPLRDMASMMSKPNDCHKFNWILYPQLVKVDVIHPILVGLRSSWVEYNPGGFQSLKAQT
jgi:hypothetical protein